MSLRADDRNSRGRNGSSARERSRSRNRNVSPPDPANYAYSARPAPQSSMPGSFDTEYDDDSRRGPPPPPSTYDTRSSTSGADRPPYGRHASVPAPHYDHQPGLPYPREHGDVMNENYWKDFPPHERPGYVPPPPGARHDDDRDLAYGDGPQRTRHASYSSQYPSRNHQQYPPQAASQPYAPHAPTRAYEPQHPTQPYRSQDPYHPQDPHHPHAPEPHRAGSEHYSDHRPSVGSRGESYPYQYADPLDKVSYAARPVGSQQLTRYSEVPHDHQAQRTYSYEHDSRATEAVPSSAARDAHLVKRPTLDARHSSSHHDTGRLTAGMGLLSVGGEQHKSAGGPPPPSPLLEAYRGTYQSISPMPLAMRPTDEDSDLSDLEPLSRSTTHSSLSGKPKDLLALEVERKKRVKLYDPEKDAAKMAEALRHSKPGTEAISEILAHLSHDEVMYLRKEYKKQVKVQGKGVNLPKHMKTKLTGNFGKVAYVTALGRWESEGYWANFWYQSHSSRRELLIESLMGRTNGEIRNIDEEFKDKRYSDSLVKCMEKELKMDKFRVAVLMVLQQRRQEEQDVYPQEYKDRDVEQLHRALTAKQGGESAMLEIIVRRSDAHLREVLRVYEKDYRENFPRAALKKSNNLVGEVIAHILNGVINKPARDAILLRHAIEDIASKNRDEELRYELLISRLVRLHWDKAHLLRVKREYYAKYSTQIESDIEGATKGDFGEFMVDLCRVKTANGALV